MANLLSHFINLPEKFLGTELDARTDNLFRWRTVKNLRCQHKIPESCFVKVSPRKVLILRDPFFDWASHYAEQRIN